MITKVVYAYVSLLLSAIVALAVSLSQRQNGKIVMRARKSKEIGTNGSKDRVYKCSHKPVKSASRTMSTRERSSG